MRSLGKTAAAPTNRRAALALVVLTPLVAELALGSTPMSMAWLTLIGLPIYGAGVLTIRELVRRAGRGWPSLIVLGVAYELVEDGIGLQALTSPTLYGAASWGPRPFGFNLPYWEANAVYHAVFSVLVPILLVETAVAPPRRYEPWLRRGGLVTAAVVAVLGVGLLRLAVPPFADPGYVAPLGIPVAAGAVAVVLGVVALRVLPPARDLPARPGGVPSRWALAGFGLAGTLVLLGLLFPAHGLPLTTGAGTPAAMIAAGALAVTAGLVVRRWWGRPGWTDGHAVALAAGALVGHSAAGIALLARTPFDKLGLVAVIVVTIAGAGLLLRATRDG